MSGRTISVDMDTSVMPVGHMFYFVSPPYRPSRAYAASSDEVLRNKYGDPLKRQPGQLYTVGGGDSIRVVRLRTFDKTGGGTSHAEWEVQDILSNKIYRISAQGLKREVNEMEAIAWAVSNGKR
jgi:hypothetical protein